MSVSSISSEAIQCISVFWSCLSVLAVTSYGQSSTSETWSVGFVVVFVWSLSLVLYTVSKDIFIVCPFTFTSRIRWCGQTGGQYWSAVVSTGQYWSAVVVRWANVCLHPWPKIAFQYARCSTNLCWPVATVTSARRLSLSQVVVCLSVCLKTGLF